MGGALRVGWYRLGATFGRRWGGYLTLVLLIGLVGGLAMRAFAGARRTESSFPTFIQGTDPADLEGPISYYQPGGGPFGAGFNPSLIGAIDRQPHVTTVEVAVGLNTLRLGRAVGALALANLMAALPGRLAARTPTAPLLHTE